MPKRYSSFHIKFKSNRTILYLYVPNRRMKVQHSQGIVEYPHIGKGVAFYFGQNYGLKALISKVIKT